MVHKTKLQRHFMGAASISLVVSIVLWIGLLMYGAAALRNQEVTSYEVALGPLVLSVLTKHKTADGFMATVSFEPGLFWYAVLCLAIGVAVACLIYMAGRNKS